MGNGLRTEITYSSSSSFFYIIFCVFKQSHFQWNRSFTYCDWNTSVYVQCAHNEAWKIWYIEHVLFSPKVNWTRLFGVQSMFLFYFLFDVWSGTLFFYTINDLYSINISLSNERMPHTLHWIEHTKQNPIQIHSFVRIVETNWNAKVTLIVLLL